MSKSIVGIPQGGTGASTAAAALTALGAYPASNPAGYVNGGGTVASANNAQQLGGLAPSTGVIGSTIVARDGNADINAHNVFAGSFGYDAEIYTIDSVSNVLHYGLSYRSLPSYGAEPQAIVSGYAGVVLGAGGAARVRLTSGGNLGIGGTMNPLSRLSFGASGINASGVPGGAPMLRLYDDGTNTGAVYGLGTSQNGGMEISANQTGQGIRFYAGTANSAPTLRFNIGGDGNVSMAGSFAANGTISTNNFIGPGSGLTGTAAALSIGGNAATATYATNSTRLYASDSGYAYGASNPYYAALTYNAPANRWRLQVTPGTPAGVEVAYADTSGNSNALNGVSGNRVMMKRRARIMSADGTNLNTSITQPEMGFTYGGTGEPSGPFIAFGGLNTDIDYMGQLVMGYGGGGNDTKFRTYNGDNGTWNPWRTIWTDGNLPTPAEGPVVSSLVKRTVNGYIQGSYINMTDDSAGGAGTGTGGPITALIGKSGDDYYRGQNATKVKAFLALTGADIAANPYFQGIVTAGRVLAPSANNLHLDGSGGAAVYLNYYSGTGGVNFCNGANGVVASIGAGGIVSANGYNGPGTGLTGTANQLTSGATNQLASQGNYVWSASQTPSAFGLGMQHSFVQAANGFPSYGSLMTMKSYTGGGGTLQMLTPYGPSQGGTQLKVRFGNYDVNSGDSWTNWKSIWDSESLTSLSQLTNNMGYIVNGGSISTLYADSWYRSTGATGWYNQTYGGGIFMQDTSYVRTYGGKDFYCDANITAGGNITAYSDERLKTNWRDAPKDFVEQWAGVKNGTYDRTDITLTQVGVSAQNVQAILPASTTEVEGFLSLNYAGATAVATVKLAERAVENTADIAALFKLVGELQARIKELEANK